MEAYAFALALCSTWTLIALFHTFTRSCVNSPIIEIYAVELRIVVPIVSDHCARHNKVITHITIDCCCARKMQKSEPLSTDWISLYDSSNDSQWPMPILPTLPTLFSWPLAAIASRLGADSASDC